MDHYRARLLAARALSGGAERVSAMRWRWNIAGRCQAPVHREVHVRPSPPHRRKTTEKEAILDPLVLAVLRAFPGATVGRVDVEVFKPTKYIVVKKGGAIPIWIELEVPCRRCDHCRERRRKMWAARARNEYQSAERTWFGTLTLSPQCQHLALARARARLARQGVDFDALAYGEQFAERHKSISPLLTLYLKRIRKETGAKLRYLLVAEAHKSGLPHYHALVHEQVGSAPVPKRSLDGQWNIGFSQWRLCSDERRAAYLCKYLGKSTAARVRASVDYGNNSLALPSSRAIGGVRGGVPPDEKSLKETNPGARTQFDAPRPEEGDR